MTSLGYHPGANQAERYGSTTQPHEEVTAMRPISNDDAFDDEPYFRGDEQTS